MLTFSGKEPSSKFYTDNNASPLKITNMAYLQTMIGRDSKDSLDRTTNGQKKSTKSQGKKLKSQRGPKATRNTRGIISLNYDSASQGTARRYSTTKGKGRSNASSRLDMTTLQHTAEPYRDQDTVVPATDRVSNDYSSKKTAVLKDIDDHLQFKKNEHSLDNYQSQPDLKRRMNQRIQEGNLLLENERLQTSAFVLGQKLKVQEDTDAQIHQMFARLRESEGKTLGLEEDNRRLREDKLQLENQLSFEQQSNDNLQAEVESLKE